MEKRKPIAAFDVDGTLYRSNFLVDLVKQLVEQRSFPARILGQVRDLEQDWMLQRHRESYAQYMDGLIKSFSGGIIGLPEEEMEGAVHEIMKYAPGMTYVHGRKRIQQLKSTHHLVAISGSPIEAVAPFVNHLGINEVHATTFKKEGGIYTGEVIHVGTHKKGQTLLEMAHRLNATLSGSTARGDTDADISMLEYVDEPEAFKPNKELIEHAMKHGWKIYLEDKDMFYRLDGNGQFFIEDNFGHYQENP
jgi:HAD superfamily hydrolase (TIGR01490 family)